MITSIEKLYKLFQQHPVISTDSRAITPGCLFFALRGEAFNGNVFAREAIGQGAAFAVIDDPTYSAEKTLLVDDVLITLQQLALHHRSELKIPVVGITGTNGKTTTKELVNAILGSHFKVHATAGNLNNHIGVPLTLLSTPEFTEIAIIEMGANHPGEIALLCEIARPTYGLITNIGKAHLEGFGGFEGVIKTKSELYRFIREHEGTAFVNGESELLCHLSEGMNRIFYGLDASFQTFGELTASDPLLVAVWHQKDGAKEICSHLVGSYNFENILAAISVGSHFGVPAEKIISAIKSYIPSNNRSQTLKTLHNSIILDAYNANPSSMQAALANFARIKADHKMAILGDMLELGIESQVEHAAIIGMLENMKIEQIILVGPEFQKVPGNRHLSFPDSSAALKWLKQHTLRDYTILVKGSRGIKMEKVLEGL